MRSFTASFALLLVIAGVASAEETGPAPAAPEAADLAATGQFLPTTVGARVTPSHVTALGLGGWDGAPGQGGTMTGMVEAGVHRRVAVRVGFDQVGNGKASGTFGARVGLLEQERAGIDLGVAAQYRNTGFTEVNGELELMVLVGRRWGNLAAVANLVFGQSPKDAGDHDGEARAGVYYQLSRALGLGLDTRARVDLGSDAASAPGSTAPAKADFDLVAGPLVTLTHGPALALLQVGAHSERIQEKAHTGLVVLGGLGCTF